MPMAKMNRVPNPADDYPPTRPGPLSVVIVAALIVLGLGIMSGSQIWSHIHLAAIETSLGL
jgi:hypothetical protein